MAKPAMVPVNIPAAYLNVDLQLVIKELFRGGRLDDLALLFTRYAGKTLNSVLKHTS